jgi:hypothetical protein
MVKNITFSMNSQTKKLFILQIKKGYYKIIIYDVERTETAAQALPAFEGDHHNQCPSTRMHRSICRRLGSWCGGRMIRAWSNMDIWWSPAFNLTVWFANENGCGYLEIA